MPWWEPADIVEVNDPAALSFPTLQWWDNPRKLAFCILNQHLSETAEQPLCTPAETTVWIYHGIWDHRLALPTALSKRQRSVMSQGPHPAPWVGSPDPAPSSHMHIMLWYLCIWQYLMHSVLRKGSPFPRLSWIIPKQCPFSAMEPHKSSGEQGQGAGEGTALQCFSLGTARAQKRPACLPGKKRCSSKFTKELFCEIIACHFCIITFWLKLLFRQGRRSEAWALLTLLSGCMAMKEAFEKSEIHTGNTRSSWRKWIKEHGALNGLKNRTASDEFGFVSSGVVLLLIFIVHNEGQCLKSSRKSQSKQCNLMAWVHIAQGRNHCNPISVGMSSPDPQTHLSTPGLFPLGNGARLFQPLSPAVLPCIPFLPECDSFYTFTISFQLQALHRDCSLGRINMASTVGPLA